MKIQPTSLTITTLLGSQNEQYVIPAYQRRYSWREQQLTNLIEDIELIEDTDTHLLGSIVCLTGHHQAGLNQLELVDGQQRLTSVSILLLCILERLRLENQPHDVIDTERLLQARPLSGPPLSKIALDSLDAQEFEKLSSGEEIEFPDNPYLAFAFRQFREWVKGKTLTELTTFLYRLKNQAIVIRLDVSSAKDAFKLFETINNRGLKLSPTDIIKNFVLGNAARFGTDSLTLARREWAALIKNLDGTDFEQFFRHYLGAELKRRLTTSFVIWTFKHIFMLRVVEAENLPERHWYVSGRPEKDENVDVAESPDDATEIEETGEQETPERFPRVSFREFLGEVLAASKIYGQLVRAEIGIPAIDRRLRNLLMIQSVQTYGFLMSLRIGKCSDADFETVLRMTESFILRRHIVKSRTSDAERTFAKLCGVDCSNPIPAISEEFRRYCPTDATFREAFSKFNYPTGIIARARYCLIALEQEQHGKLSELLVAGSDLVEVEHIIPQKIWPRWAKEKFGDWPAYLGKESEAIHPRYSGRIGNLTLLAGALNLEASNNPYEKKKKCYLNSAIKLTSSLPVDYPEFRFEQVEARSEKFAERAIALWPLP